jgi:NADH-quinone oxidoreductase subunit F
MTADTKPLTYRVDLAQPLDIRGYQLQEGYAAVRKALKEMQPSEVTHWVKEANLRGRGGADFPTGVKWSLVPMGEGAPRQKYLICNADEMEPGTFKDRLLMEGAPHQLVEAMIVSGYAIQASRGYIFLRGEYVLAAERLERAIAEARAAGYLGANLLGSPWSFELFVHTGAGRYIPGEETALINSLEGRRAHPRAKPPFPQIAGLWGKPTVVNNVETLCNVPHIVLRGIEWYRGLAQGKSKDSGTKLYGVSGRVLRPGLWELPFGVPAREILEEHAGGMKEGLKLKCWLPGGASTDFLMPEHLDLAMDFETIAKAGSRMGTGLLTVVDDSRSIISVVRNLEEFFARDSWPRRLAVERAAPRCARARRGPAGRHRDTRATVPVPGPGPDLLRSRAGSGRAAAVGHQVFPPRVRGRHREAGRASSGSTHTGCAGSGLRQKG